MLTTLACLTIAALAQPAKAAPAAQTHEPSAQERHAALSAALGWVDLTGPNARTLWRGYKQAGFPAKGWTLTPGDDNLLSSTAGGSGGDLMTVEQYGDFEVEFQFKCAPKANSGVIYRSTEKHDASWQTGPEYQVIDDAGNNLKPDDAHSAGALYDIARPPADKVYKTDGWNRGRIYLRSGLLQHWLNGEKVAEIVAFDGDGKPTEAWNKAIAASKFKVYEGFGLQPRGSIVLQDHGDQVTYANIQARSLDKPVAGEVALFNGKDLTGWLPVVPELTSKNEDPAQVWSIKEGVLHCRGTPGGYIRTTQKYTNYILHLEWRFDPALGAGNSGVLLRVNGDDKVWPRSMEAQLESGSAGNFWNIEKMNVQVAEKRTSGRNTKRIRSVERPLGQWNQYEIIVNKGDIVLRINGQEVNACANCEQTPGYIALQSEGSHIEFRDIRLVPLP